MKKLYRKGTVHPSPPIISDHLSFLPATILTLTAALSPEDREVLAYLISCSCSGGGSVNLSSGPPRRPPNKGGGKGGGGGASGGGSEHPPQFNCDCFGCYTSYWVRWGSSPNRQLIHEIIDAFEDELLAHQTKAAAAKNNKSRKERRKRGAAAAADSGNIGSGELKPSELSTGRVELGDQSESVQSTKSDNCSGGGGGDQGEVDEESSEKGSVRSFVSFIGERIWGVWG